MKIIKETKKYYWVEEPVYEKYVTKEVSDYCECCGNEIGSHEEKEGVNQMGKKIVKRKKGPFYGMGSVLDKAIDEYYQGIVSRSFSESYQGEGLNIPNITRL